MADKCLSQTNLEIHHRNRGKGNELSNAEVLCHDCHVNTKSYGMPGFNPPDFTDTTKVIVKTLAGNRCQCTRENCH